MQTRRRVWNAGLGALSLAAAASAQTTTLISQSPGGAAGDFHSDSPVLSADGRFVVFSSQASNLVANDTNQTEDVFIHDRLSGTIACVSLGAGGTPSIGQSALPSVSSNGRYIAFWSVAWNIVPGNTTVLSDIFLTDTATGATVRCSDTPTGGDGNNISGSPSLSGDGRWVAFSSYSSNLVAGDTNGVPDVFMYDALSNTTTRVSRSASAGVVNGSSGDPAISSDASCVAFFSAGTNLVAGDTNAVDDVFAFTFASGVNERISVATGGAQANGASRLPKPSSDGRFVAFQSVASNLAAGDSNGELDIFVRDRVAGTTERISVDSFGAQANDESQTPWISGDGRFVVFWSRASNLVAGDTNLRVDHFLRDRVAGLTTRVSVDSSGAQGNHICYAVSISADGELIALSTMSSLAPADTNGRRDVYVRDRFLRPTAYCTAGTSSGGCVPAISSSGSASATANSGFTIQVASLEALKAGLVFYGASGANASPWGGGSASFLCVKPPTQRTPPSNTGGTLFSCEGSLSLDLLAFWAANPNALGQPIALGQRYHAQAWYRDPMAPKTTNLSDALAFDLVP